MRVVVMPSKGEAGKFSAVSAAFPQVWHGQLLDIGCRSGKLKQALAEHPIHYVGLDVQCPAAVVSDLNAGLPFGCRSFDVVVALDVLEHTADIYRSTAECCRIARRFVVITLPNIYSLRSRLRFLRGEPISEKYGLPPEPPADRHHWHFTLREAQHFLVQRALLSGFALRDEACVVGPRRGSMVGRMVSGQAPGLMAQFYLALLERTAEAP
jgi:SAM-dependent methyltransferase